jgi:hypothetical protein
VGRATREPNPSKAERERERTVLAEAEAAYVALVKALRQGTRGFCFLHSR